MMHGKSLIYMLNSNGPKTNPWGTPCLTTSQSDRRLGEWQTAIQLFVFYYANKILINLIQSILLHKNPTSKSKVHD